MVLLTPTKWLFHWGYTPFSDIPIFIVGKAGFSPNQWIGLREKLWENPQMNNGKIYMVSGEDFPLNQSIDQSKPWRIMEGNIFLIFLQQAFLGRRWARLSEPWQNNRRLRGVASVHCSWEEEILGQLGMISRLHIVAAACFHQLIQGF